MLQVKINGSNEEMLRAAAEQFGSKSSDEITYVARETLEGHQRAIMGNMTVEAIYRERKEFSEKVFEVASTDLVNMGIQIISYTIKDITDDVGYLAVSSPSFLFRIFRSFIQTQTSNSSKHDTELSHTGCRKYSIIHSTSFQALGQGRTAEVQRDARVGEAEARMEAGIAEARAVEQQMEAKLINDTEIARAKRDFDAKKASYDVEVNTAKAEAELAFELQVRNVKPN